MPQTTTTKPLESCSLNSFLFFASTVPDNHLALYMAELFPNLTISPQGSSFSSASPVFYAAIYQGKSDIFPVSRWQYRNTLHHH